MNIFYCCDILKSETTDTAIIAAGDFNPVSDGFYYIHFEINQYYNHFEINPAIWLVKNSAINPQIASFWVRLQINHTLS